AVPNAQPLVGRLDGELVPRIGQALITVVQPVEGLLHLGVRLRLRRAAGGVTVSRAARVGAVDIGSNARFGLIAFLFGRELGELPRTRAKAGCLQWAGAARRDEPCPARRAGYLASDGDGRHR